MFDFENLEVYKKSKFFYREIRSGVISTTLEGATKNQLNRAALSIVLNIAEGSGRNSKADKRNFFVISRGSVFECIAVLDILKEEKLITVEKFQEYYAQAEEIPKCSIQ